MGNHQRKWINHVAGALLLLAGLLWVSASGAASDPIASQAALEHDFDAQIDPNDLKDWMKILTSQPNHVGSPHDKANAEQIQAWFKSWGWDARIENFWVLY